MGGMRIGEFELVRRLGRGGMGEVWLGRHQVLHVPVAVKLTVDPPSDEEAMRAFEAETSMVAGLDHPNVVRVIDVGRVERARPESGPFHEGSPWLAMELAAGGSVFDHRPRNAEELVYVLTALLRGLGHAHAHGIVHRDIKGGNLLVCGPAGSPDEAPRSLLEGRIVLSDFGISRLIAPTAGEDAHSNSGTTAYMAPEQIHGASYLMGPWTDLYQVGVLAWLLATGAYPFRGRTRHATLFAHLTKPPPAFEPQISVPRGFEDWLRQLLRKDPAERYAFAAEALEALDTPEQTVSPTTLSRLSEQPTSTRRPAPRSESPLPDAPAARSTPWRPRPPNDRADAPRPAWGTGLSLVGLRSPPLRGRATETELLWNTLLEVHGQRTGRTVVLEGTPGVGRQRLADWLATQAHEAGAAHVVRAALFGDASDGEHLARAVLGLSPADPKPVVVARLESWLGADSLTAEVLGGYLAGEAVAATDLHSAIAEALRRQARTHVVVLVCSNGFAHATSRRMLRDIHRHLQRLPAPVLVVTTRDIGQEALEVDGLEGVEVVFVPPLGRAEVRQVVKDVAQLAPEVVAKLVEAARGQVGTALQQLGEWVQSASLVPSPTNFVPADGVPLKVDAAALERTRLQRIRAHCSAEDLDVLQLAAMLGRRIDRDTWYAACVAAGRPFPSGVRERAARQGLLRRAADGTLYFVSDALRSDLAHADPEDHALLAWVLADRGAGPGSLAPHLEAAENWGEAYQAYYDHACALLEDGAEALEAIEGCERMLGASGVPRSDERWGAVGVLRSWRHQTLGELAESETVITHVIAQARLHAWPTQLVRGLRQRVHIAFARGEHVRCLELAQEALELSRARGDQLRFAGVNLCVGDVHVKLGAFELAAEHFDTAIVAARQAGHRPSEVQGLLARAQVEIHLQQLEDAVPFLEQARGIATEHRMQPQLTSILNYLGELARVRGDREEALALYGEAAARYLSQGRSDAIVPAINLALMRIEDDRFKAAESTLRRLAGPWISQSDRGVLQLYLQVALLTCDLRSGRPDDGRTDWVLEQLDRHHVVDGDLAYLLDRAAEALAETPRTDAARRLWEVARTIQLSVGNTELAQEIEGELAALS